MTEDPYTIDWAEAVPRLAATAHDDSAWNASVARELVRPSDRTAVDIGCGGAGMTLALAVVLGAPGRVMGVDGSADVLTRAREVVASAATDGAAGVEFLRADLDGDLGEVRTAVPDGADLVWASASVHHAGDQQAAVTTLAGLLAPRGRLALAEGGLPARYLPWDVGTGDPGLEVRLHAAQDRWFAGMRERLPGSVRMPYGWPEALRRAGLERVETRSWLIERPAPLPADERAAVAHRLGAYLERLARTDLLAPADLDAWNVVLDPDRKEWIGHRDDLYRLEARSVHVGVRA